MTTTILGKVRPTFRGPYDNAVQYEYYDMVDFEGSSYIAKEDVIGVLPTDSTKWQLNASKGSTGVTGQTGANGKDGTSPTAIVSKVGDTATISITDENGTTTATVKDGTNGTGGSETIVNVSSESNYNESFSESSDAYLPNRVLVWEDDFTGNELNPLNWKKYVRAYPSALQYEYYVDHKDIIKVENSNLVITAKKGDYLGKPWRSGRINSNNLQEFQYGRIEAKMKFPKGIGFVPAFWTLGANSDYDSIDNSKGTGVGWPQCGEIDIMEHVSNDDFVASTAHFKDGSGNDVSSGAKQSATLDFTQWHVYAVEWTSAQLIFFVDGVQTGVMNLSDADASGDNPFRKPQHLLFNISIGGADWVGYPDSGVTSYQMLVDWVRVYAPVGEVGIAEPQSLALNQTTATLTVGSKITIVGTILPSNVVDKTMIWSTSDENVAIVGGGVVTAIGSGTCTIYCKTKNRKFAFCQVTVN